MRSFLVLLFLAAQAVSGAAYAQSDVGLVNLVSGNVAFIPRVGQPGKVRNFMKVREGDRFQLSQGAQMRIVFYEGSRQERWQGPASFRAGRSEAIAVQGSATEVQALPVHVPQRMARLPDLIQHARLGGVQVRGTGPARRPGAESLADARGTYQLLRTRLGPDDITAELYLFSALYDHELYEEMAPLVDEMQKKQPGAEEVRSLAAWLRGRRSK
ncbi:MAG TPA: hypothetical protein VEB41_05430 [Burkholderiales bacterium]|nr:hypothetical protein [Burkholderiales bacterium]